MSIRPPTLMPIAILVAACQSEEVPTVQETETDPSGPSSGSPTWSTTAAGTATETTTETSTEGGTTGGEPAGLDCPAFEPPSGTFTAPAPDTESLTGSGVCSGLPSFPPGGVSVEIYYPGDESEDPAEGRFPVVVFHHGNNLDPQEYGYLFAQLQASGFVVLNVSAGMTFSTLNAIDAMRCALRWFYLESSYFEEVGSCELVLAGHSRGGAAAQILPLPLRDPILEGDLVGTHVAAMVLLASSASSGGIELQDYSPSQSIPLLTLGSSSDEDVPGWILTSYDRMARENMLPLLGSSPMAYKGAVWIYDLPHTAFGGESPPSSPGRLSGTVYEDKGHIITASYVDRFLRWQVFGESDERPYFVGDALPPEVDDSTWWAHLVPYRGSPETCSAISVEQDCTDIECDWVTGTCEGTPSCDQLDTEQSCTAAECVWENSACGGRIPILTSFMLDTRADGTRKLAEVFEEDYATIDTSASMSFDFGHTSEIVPGVNLGNRHDTRAVLAAMTSTDPGAEITISTLPVDASAMNHASFRLGVRSRVDGELPPASVCDLEHQDSTPLTLRVSDAGMDSATVELLPLIQADAILTYRPVPGNPPTFILQCEPQLFMQTQRVPMTALCDGSILDLENLDTWTFSFTEGVAERDEVVIDTLEFTYSDADDASVGQCSQQTALWACEASTSILPQRPVCSDEPVSGTCPSESIGAEGLDVPEVPSAWGGPFDGWVVHMPAGYGDDPWDPAVRARRCDGGAVRVRV